MKEVHEIFDKNGRLIKKIIYEYDEVTGKRRKVGEEGG